MQFFDRLRLTSMDLLQRTLVFLKEKYNITADTQLTVASPWFHILTAVAGIAELIIGYLSLAQEENNLTTAQHDDSIKGLVSLTGYEPFRGQSAQARVELQLNSGISYRSVVIKDGTAIRNTETGLNFFVSVPDDKLVLSINNGDNAEVDLIQGDKKEESFISDGTANQSFNPTVKNMTDHNMIEVYVNGKRWRKSGSFYDMNKNEEAFIVKTSPNMGFVIMFGNGSFGAIPVSGAVIKVKYVVSAGQDGNAGTANIWTWTDTGTTPDGDTVDLNEVVSVSTIDSPALGCDFEDAKFSKLIAPLRSQSMILATADNFKHYLSRYDDYKVLDVWTTHDDIYVEDDNVVYIKMLPKIEYRLTDNNDYFSYSDEFIMSDTEKQRFYDMFEQSGKLLVGIEPVILDVAIRKFAIVIKFRYFEDVSESVAKLDIRKALSNYFMNMDRKDYIPVSDIVGEIEKLNSVDSCTVSFLTEDNERAKRYGEYYKQTIEWDAERQKYQNVKRLVSVDTDEDPHVGMTDSGDIKIGKDELWVCRGGWETANGISLHEYQENNNCFGPLLMVADEKVKRINNNSKE